MSFIHLLKFRSRQKINQFDATKVSVLRGEGKDKKLPGVRGAVGVETEGIKKARFFRSGLYRQCSDAGFV
jgi:hypothetical protein